jgi:shikimate 5-dehydrogenase/3-dehydroquinate dehydratase
MLPRCANADIVELRLDALTAQSPEAALHLDWQRVRAFCQRPLIVTYRIAAEGGFLTASEGQSAFDDRRAALFQAAIDAEVEYIDLEAASWLAMKPRLRFRTPSIDTSTSDATSSAEAKPHRTQVVLSKHFFQALDDEDSRCAGGMSTSRIETELDALFAFGTHETRGTEGIGDAASDDDNDNDADISMIYKLIFTAATMEDGGLNAALAARHGLAYAQQRGHRAIIHAMGEAGEASRILGNAWTGGLRNAWAYCALEAGANTASGQLTLDEARELYQLSQRPHNERAAATLNTAPSITLNTAPEDGSGVFGLLGFPTKQSKGKFLHNRLYQHFKQSLQQKWEEDPNASQSLPEEASRLLNNFLYLNFPTPDAENFWQEWVREGNHVQGFSVTIPHKERIFAILQHEGTLSDAALRSGVCNTAVRTPTGWQGHNTDVLALEDCFSNTTAKMTAKMTAEAIANAQASAEKNSEKSSETGAKTRFHDGTLIIGTGATTQSAISALLRLGVAAERLTLTGRNTERGKMLASKYGCAFQTEEAIIHDVAKEHRSFAAVLQTTPVGMYPKPESTPLPEECLASLFTAQPVVMDVIYNPVVTKMLRMAQEAGCETISGEEMFLRQAAHQFRLFTGYHPTLKEIRAIWSAIPR